MAHVHIAHRPLGGDRRHRAVLSIAYLPFLAAGAFVVARLLAHDTTAARAAWQLTIVWAVAEIIPVFGAWSALKALPDGGLALRFAAVLNLTGVVLVTAAVAVGGFIS